MLTYVELLDAGLQRLVLQTHLAHSAVGRVAATVATAAAAVATAFRTGHLRGIRQQRKIAYAVSLR